MNLRRLATFLLVVGFPVTANAAPLFYAYMDVEFGAIGDPRLASTYDVTPLQGPDSLTFQMKVGDTVSITAADGSIFAYNADLVTNGSRDFLSSFFSVPGA